MGDTNAMAAAFEEALKSGDFNRLGETASSRYATDDFVDEYPAVRRATSKQAPDPDGRDVRKGDRDQPNFSYKRMLGGGDVFVVEGSSSTATVPVVYVGIGEVREGKVAKMTEYFANPFDAPAWRADFVEPMEPTTA